MGKIYFFKQLKLTQWKLMKYSTKTNYTALKVSTEETDPETLTHY